jgi:alkylation response protein AidB-like acyl-CoA dehydrogenase
MRSLDIGRELCEKIHPGLLDGLTGIPLAERESPGSPVIDLFRKHGGAGLLVPPEYSGAGADPLTAVRVTRALSAVSPSLGAAVTMHHFTVSMLFSLTENADRLTAAQRALLARVATDSLLIASGWAEGKPNQNILTPAVTAQPAGGGYLINGGKKPCSLSRSMDLLTASVSLPVGPDESSLAVLLIPADSPGITVHPFWDNPILAGAESDEVRLSDVLVPEDLVIRTVPDDPSRLDDLQAAGFVWFEMLISSVYVGAASALVEQALRRKRGSVTDRAALAVKLESAVALVEGVARGVRQDLASDEAVADVLVARFAAQEAIVEAANQAAELLGGIAFIQSDEVSYLTSAVRPLAFHPPSRTSVAEPLLGYFTGAPLVLS